MRSLWRGIPLQCDGKTAEAAARRGDQSERTGIIRKEYGMTTIHVKGLDKLRFMCAEYKPTVELYGRFVGKCNVIEHFTTMPEQIIFNGTTTICIFHDKTKVISRPQKGEKFDKETGVAMCIAKYIYGSRSKFLKAVEGGHEQKVS